MVVFGEGGEREGFESCLVWIEEKRTRPSFCPEQSGFQEGDI